MRDARQHTSHLLLWSCVGPMIRSQDYDMHCQLHEYCTKQSILSYVEQIGRAAEENT